ncbi:hypothetical protein B0I35DRAFT_58262 [Stachybotrys elegans]|uniref:Uncharacterized protein n=1 Tax=Stachybotrys elegans TaxID=80388 RepID=A0A8K0SME6_9HYPO|nr:hypothetical protein B0I35DRAFT_58262 [Stachybotrys elegans]
MRNQRRRFLPSHLRSPPAPLDRGSSAGGDGGKEEFGCFLCMTPFERSSPFLDSQPYGSAKKGDGRRRAGWQKEKPSLRRGHVRCFLPPETYRRGLASRPRRPGQHGRHASFRSAEAGSTELSWGLISYEGRMFPGDCTLVCLDYNSPA